MATSSNIRKVAQRLGINGTSEIDSSWLKNYKLVEFLGSGSYGVVYKADKKYSKESFAIKITYLQKHLVPGVENPQRRSELREKMRREFLLPSRKVHENIVNVYESLECRIDEPALNKLLKPVSNSKDRGAILAKASMNFWAGGSGLDALLIRMELCGINLRQWIEDCTIKDPELCIAQINIINGILTGVEFLHENKILHRDLKSENIFFAHGSYDYHVKIGDFGISRVIQSDDNEMLTMKPKVTPLYRAPELDTVEYSFQADLYSLGLLIYEIVNMIKANDRDFEFTRLKERTTDDEFLKKLFENTRDVIFQLTEEEPKNRIETVEDVKIKLHDQFVLEEAEYSTAKFSEITSNYKSVFGAKGGTVVTGDFELSCDNRIVSNVAFRGNLKINGNNNKLSSITFQSEKTSWLRLSVKGSDNILKRITTDCSELNINLKGDRNTVSNISGGESNDVGIYIKGGSGHIVENSTLSPISHISFAAATSSCIIENVKCGYINYLRGMNHICRNIEFESIGVYGEGHTFDHCKGRLEKYVDASYEFIESSLSIKNVDRL